MIKRKLMITSIAGIVVFGGAIGAAAAANNNSANADKHTAGIISMEKAKTIALNETGGKLTSIELEKEDGRLVYDIEMIRGNSEEIDLDIDAATGNILKVDTDDDHEYKYDRPLENGSVKMSLEDAIDVALKDTAGEVHEAEFDSDGYYEIDIRSDHMEVEFKIDANTGKIIEKEIDDID